MDKHTDLLLIKVNTSYIGNTNSAKMADSASVTYYIAGAGECTLLYLLFLTTLTSLSILLNRFIVLDDSTWLDVDIVYVYPG